MPVNFRLGTLGSRDVRDRRPRLPPAELAVGVTNQSQNAFDASPAGTFVEDTFVTRLAQLHGFPGGSGVMTMGGTSSNLLGLLLARDRACEDVRRRGVPTNDWRIVASEAAHDSVRRSAALLGLGTDSVIGVPTDETGAMDVDALDAVDAHVIAIAGTAGTTDLGAIDPHDALADRARERGAWFEPDHDLGGRGRVARPGRQRRSVTGSLTLRTSPAGLRTLPVIQTVFSRLRGFAGSRRRTERTRSAVIERRTTGPRSVRLERSRAVSRTLIAHA